MRFYAWAAALSVILGLPLAFLAVPGSGMFLMLVPLWIIGTALLLAATYFSSGAKGVLGVSGLFAAVALWAAFGQGFTERLRCGRSPMALRSASIRQPAVVVFDNASRMVSFSAGQHHPLEMVAVLTGAEVIEISRFARGHIDEAWSMKATSGPNCSGPESRNTIKAGGGRRQKIDLCLSSTKRSDVQPAKIRTLDPGHEKPTIVFEVNLDQGTGPRSCDVVEVFEASAGKKRQLGRFVRDWRDNTLRPDPRGKGADRNDHWFTAIIKAVLGDQVDEVALKRHFAS